MTTAAASTNPIHPPRRRRTGAWVVAACAAAAVLAVAFSILEQRRQAAIVAELESRGVVFTRTRSETWWSTGSSVAGRAWRKLFPESWEIVGAAPEGYLDEDAYRKLSQIKTLRHVELWKVQVTDETLQHLSLVTGLADLGIGLPEGRETRVIAGIVTLKNLRTLNLGGKRLTEEGLRQITRLEKLTTLTLFNMELTDDCMRPLASLRSLRQLELMDNPITDAGLEHLLPLKNLTWLDLRETRLTNRSVQTIKRMMTRGEVWFPDSVSQEARDELRGASPDLSVNPGGTISAYPLDE